MSSEEQKPAEEQISSTTVKTDLGISSVESSDSAFRPSTTNVKELASAIVSSTLPEIQHLSTRLVELQEAQLMLSRTIESQRSEFLESSPDWQEAKILLDQIPSYYNKITLIKQTMKATQQLNARVEKGTLALVAKLDEREKERAAKKSQDAAGFQSVMQS